MAIKLAHLLPGQNIIHCKTDQEQLSNKKNITSPSNGLGNMIPNRKISSLNTNVKGDSIQGRKLKHSKNHGQLKKKVPSSKLCLLT